MNTVHVQQFTSINHYVWVLVKPGTEQNRMEWNGIEWNGTEWNRTEWNGMEQNSME